METMGSQPSPCLVTSSLTAPQPTPSNPRDRATPSAAKERADILRHFDAVFSEAPALSAEDLTDTFRLRYLVYCLDRGFEDAQSCPSGLEYDDYDQHASHCLLRDRHGKRPLGTVRVVTTTGAAEGIESLPLAEYASAESMDVLRSLPGASTAEVSRFAISRSARDILRQSAEAAEARFGTAGESQRPYDKLLPYMALGLFRGIIRVSMRRELTHWCLAAEPSLIRRLRSLGLHLRPVGPLIEHRGLRQICYAEITELLARVEAERPEIWDVMTLGGLLLSNEPARTVA
jgi:N-acyl amino acid synthase of PEP-CTERM/exosortase system